jgi:hypothetical protein
METSFFSPADKPELVRIPLTSKAAADKRETARLVCEARGVPNVTLAWQRLGGAFVSASGEPSKYQITNTQIDPIRWRSELQILNVSNEDYGAYECVAKNTEGRNTNTHIPY